jgi:hypothetical protein
MAEEKRNFGYLYLLSNEERYAANIIKFGKTIKSQQELIKAYQRGGGIITVYRWWKLPIETYSQHETKILRLLEKHREVDCSNPERKTEHICMQLNMIISIIDSYFILDTHTTLDTYLGVARKPTNKNNLDAKPTKSKKDTKQTKQTKNKVVTKESTIQYLFSKLGI